MIVTDSGGCLGLPQKPFSCGRVRRQFRRQDFDRDRAIELGVMASKHDSHPATSDHIADLVLTQPAERLRIVAGMQKIELAI